MIEERIPKLDLSTWDKDKRQFVLDLADVMTYGGSERLKEHVDLIRRAPSGIYDDWYLEMPSVYSLLKYGEDGIRALLELGLEGEYWAPHILVAVILSDFDAVQQILRFTQAYLEDDAYDRLIGGIENTLKKGVLALAAEKALTTIVHTFLADPDQRHNLGTLIMSVDIVSPQRKGSSSVIDLILKTIGRGTLRISEPICDELERLIAEDRQESDYQRFFEKHPALIDPLASSIIGRQNLGAEWETDFVIRRLDDEYIFVEIEKPQDMPFTAYPHPSSSLSHAIGQVLNWLAWIEDNIAYAQSHGYPGRHVVSS